MNKDHLYLGNKYAITFNSDLSMVTGLFEAHQYKGQVIHWPTPDSLILPKLNQCSQKLEIDQVIQDYFHYIVNSRSSI